MTLLIMVLLPQINEAQIIGTNGYLTTNDRSEECNKNGSTGSGEKVE